MGTDKSVSESGLTYWATSNGAGEAGETAAGAGAAADKSCSEPAKALKSEMALPIAEESAAKDTEADAVGAMRALSPGRMSTSVPPKSAASC